MNDKTVFKKPIILAIDDDAENLFLLVNILKDKYKVIVATGGYKALEILKLDNEKPDLILLDVMMPELNGFNICQQLKANINTIDIPIIFLTAKNDTGDQAAGLELGAVDYITKPIDPAIVLARVKNHISLKAAQDFINDKNAFLEEIVRTRTAELTAIQDVTIQAMASMAETRDNETGHHIRRTQHYVKLLAINLRFHARFSHFLDNDEIIDSLFKSAPLHDIGKVGIPDNILLKPGRLTPNEFEIMKTHTTLGRDCIQRAEIDLGVEIPFLLIAKEIAYSHQEKWDGSGYPQGLTGENIPISARLMAVADVYDTLICRRVYKEPKSHEEAKKIILEGKGIHFDADIVDAFLALENEFQLIAAKYSD
jgi:putative two-component system response regulator